MAKRIRADFSERGTLPWFMKDKKEDVKMKPHGRTTIYDAHRLLQEFDMHKDETKKTPKEITIRFSDTQIEKMKSFGTLEHKEQLNIMQAVMDFIVKQVKNGSDLQKNLY